MNKNLEKNQVISLGDQSIVPQHDLRTIPEPRNLLNYFETNFSSIHEKLDSSKQEILDAIDKKNGKKEKPHKMLLRDPVDFDFYLKIMKSPREKHERILHHSRFRVAITLLFFTGCRVNEIRNLTSKEVYGLLNDRNLVINHSKTKSLRRDDEPWWVKDRLMC